MKKGKFLLFIFLICFFLIYTLLRFETKKELHEENEIVCKNCNVILISIDNLRADHLGCYGYNRNTTPNIDKLAEKGIIFTNVITQVSWTLSHLPMLSSLYISSALPIYSNFSTLQIPNYIVLLPEILKEKNYTTAAFVNAPFLSSFYHFNKGFDFFDEKGVFNREEFGDIKDVNTRIINWLEKNKKNKFFIFVHYYDVHDPYHPEEYYYKLFDENYTNYLSLKKKLGILSDKPLDNSNISKRERETVIAAYDAKIRYTDENIKKLVDKLEGLNLLKNTIIIITSDHGNPLGDHGVFSHGTQLYDESLHVPLILILPKTQRKIVKEQVRSIDIMPTVLEILGFQIPNHIDGESLVPLIEGKKLNIIAFSESADLISMRNNSIKFIFNIKTGEEELYNLSNDPKELFNIADKISTKNFQLEIFKFVKRNEDKLISLSKNYETKYGINETMREKIEERLRELGYIK